MKVHPWTPQEKTDPSRLLKSSLQGLMKARVIFPSQFLVLYLCDILQTGCHLEQDGRPLSVHV